jgi:DNA-binding CsgD family transcriptional regulator
MARRKAEKDSKNKRRGRPSKEWVTLRCLTAMGWGVRLGDLIRELEGATVVRVSESTVRNHLKRITRQGVPVFWRLKLVPVTEESLSDTCIGKLLKFVLRGRAEFIDQKFLYLINTATPIDIMALIAFTSFTTSYLVTGGLHSFHLSMMPFIVASSVYVTSWILRITAGSKLKQRLGISRNITLIVGTPDGRMLERKFRANTKVMEVIKWAAAELYGDKDADVTEYILLYEGKELDRYAKLWEYNKLWIWSGNDQSKGPYLVLIRRKKK